MLTRNPRPPKKTPPGTWKLQDAKARFSEIVRRAQAEGPQRVTVHGKDAVVIVAAADYPKATRLGGKRRTGGEFVAAMREAHRLGLKMRPLHEDLPISPPLRFSDDDR